MHKYLDDPDYDYLDTLDDHEARWKGHHFQKTKRKAQKEHDEMSRPVAEPEHPAADGFAPTFSASRHEREWILTYLGGFYHDHLITDVLRQVKGGKEAQVYCCQAGPATGMGLIAAKVYRPRIFRTMKNDSLYRLGQDFLDPEGNRGRRVNLAMRKKTGFGLELLHGLWLANEYQSLRVLHAAGADVPKPVALGDNAMLMEYLGDEELPAPALIQVRLPSAQARSVYDRLMENVEIMFAHKRIHADLSAHNVLYWDGQAKIIDFPQAVDPYVNPEAFDLLLRDVERLGQYFARYGIETDAMSIARGLWTKYVL